MALCDEIWQQPRLRRICSVVWRSKYKVATHPAFMCIILVNQRAELIKAQCALSYRLSAPTAKSHPELLDDLQNSDPSDVKMQ